MREVGRSSQSAEQELDPGSDLRAEGLPVSEKIKYSHIKKSAYGCRIALFAPDLNCGGAERVLVNLAHGLRAHGVAVDVVLARATGTYLQRLPSGARIIDLDAGRVVASLLPLAQYLRRNRPDAMIGFMDHANVVAALATSISRSPTRLITTVHSMWSRPRLEVTYAQRLQVYILSQLARHVYARSSGVVAVSTGVAEDLSRIVSIPLHKVNVIYNPVITSELFANAQMAIDHPWFQKDQPPVVLGLGRLTSYKDFPTLLRAFQRVRAKQVCRLMILGDGEDRSALEALTRELGIANDVLLPGFAENPYMYLSRCRVFVLSSISEGLPTALIEALALGVTVVSTDCASGPREILENGKHGDLVPIGNPTLLSEAIIRALNIGPKLGDLQHLSRFTSQTATTSYMDLCLRWPTRL